MSQVSSIVIPRPGACQQARAFRRPASPGPDNNLGKQREKGYHTMNQAHTTRLSSRLRRLFGLALLLGMLTMAAPSALALCGKIREFAIPTGNSFPAFIMAGLMATSGSPSSLATRLGNCTEVMAGSAGEDRSPGSSWAGTRAVLTKPGRAYA